jgi:peptide/nickel transport system substrate-binding protein
VRAGLRANGARARSRRRVLAATLALLVVTGAAAAVTAGPAAAARPDRAKTQAGGTIRIAAEEELTCADWIASCAGSSWGNWTLGVNTLPQALPVDDNGNYEPGAILTGFPVLDPGPPMKVTYHIKPEANWSDGQPITSTDFQYLWKQITTGKDIYDSTGYEDISQIDTSDPKTAVVVFKQPYAAWKDLFGGFYFLVPSHLLQGKDRHKEMKDGYAFSGGPWMLQGGKSGWKKGRTLTLVANPNYWGTKPTIGKVVFQFVTESAAELDAVKTGQVVSAFPTPSTGMLDTIDQQSNLSYQLVAGNQFEALWYNAAAFPLNSKAVRQSVSYVLDRQAIVNQILKPSIRTGSVLQSFIVPTFKQYYEPSFQDYKPNPDKVTQLMTADGWAKKNGKWAKNGKTATIEISTTTGIESRQLEEEIMRSELTQAGFGVKIRNQSSDVFFGTTIPKGTFAAAIFASVGTPDPGLCTIFCSENVPSKANQFTGQNVTRTNSLAVDQNWKAVDTDLNNTTRTASAQAGQAALADDASSLPLYQAPEVFIWDHTRIGGRVEPNNPTMGPYFTMNEWTLKG